MKKRNKIIQDIVEQYQKIGRGGLGMRIKIKK